MSEQEGAFRHTDDQTIKQPSLLRRYYIVLVHSRERDKPKRSSRDNEENVDGCLLDDG